MNSVTMVSQEELRTLIADEVSKQLSTHERDEDLLTVDEVADLLSLKVPTVYSKISNRELPSFKIGKRVYFSRKEILGMVRNGRQKTRDEIAEDVDHNLNR